MLPVRNLCLSRHPNSPAFHDLSSFLPFRDGIQCHSEVHGSDIDAKFFR